MRFAHCILSRDKTPLLVMSVEGRQLIYTAEIIEHEVDIERIDPTSGLTFGGFSMPAELFDEALELMIQFGGM